MLGKIRYYFPGGNTSEGFISYYDHIMPQNIAKHIFCIKGGPGTGKSTLMRKIGMKYLNNGVDVDFLKCSSDPNSLDGIVLKDRGVTIIDGTAPHITDPINPGVVDEIVDLAKYIDGDQLMEHRDKIIDLNNSISEEFNHAYIYLKCAAVKYRHMNEILKKSINDTAVYNFISSIKSRNNNRTKGNVKKIFGSAITSAGLISDLVSIAKGISDIYLLDVPAGYDTGDIISDLSHRLISSGHNVEELYCPMRPKENPEHLISYDAGIAVFTCNDYHSVNQFDMNKVVSIEKMLLPEENTAYYKSYRSLFESSKEDIQKAVSILSTAKSMHDLLEEYYINAMDFDATEELFDMMICKIDRYGC